MRAVLKRLAITTLLGATLLLVVGPWALYGIGLQAVSGTPTPPVAMAPRNKQLEAWRQARGVGEPEGLAVNPYTYLPLSLEPGTHHPTLLLAWWVATEHYDKNRRPRGNLWRQLSCGALVIWLTRTWSIEQLLSKSVELLPGKSAA